MTPSQTFHWLLQCRPGFERDCASEAIERAHEHGRELKPVSVDAEAGFVLLADSAGFAPAVVWRDLAFTRQVVALAADIVLPERDRLTPILTALPVRPVRFGTVWLETPDTNDGKSLSSFCRKFQPLLEERLQQAERLDAREPARLHLFFPSKSRVLIGWSDLAWSSPWPMGILRLRMPAEAPSRSTLKLAEAFEVFLGRDGQAERLREGMTAVDLGAAPGGWTFQLVRRGIKTFAIDNGPMKGACDGHHLVKHLRADGFKFRPQHPVDWLVCDMVEQPSRVAELIGRWFADGMARQAIFNLKLPMKKRIAALDDALRRIDDILAAAGIRYSITAKQLYHDREEVTVYLALPKQKRR